MSLESRLASFAASVGADIKALFSKLPANGAQATGKGELVFNVKDYGAKGDGSQHEESYIQAAVDACAAAGGGIVLIPPGDYLTYTWVEFKGYSNIWVQGYGATIRKNISSTAFSLIAGSATTGYGAGGRNLRFSGLRFKGNLPTAANPSGNMICAFNMHHVSGAVFEQLTFDEVQHQHHTFDMQGCENVTIRDCDFIGFNPATTAYAECIQADCSAMGSATLPDTAGSYDGLFCQDIYVQNNRFLPKTVEGVDYPCPNAFASHARLEGKFHRNLQFTGNLVVDPAAQVAVADDDTGLGDNPAYGVIHMPAVKGFLVSGNTFRQTKTDRACKVISVSSVKYGLGSGANLNATGGAPSTWTNPVMSEDIKITDNTFEGFAASASGPNFQETIYLNGHSSSAAGYINRVQITGNTFVSGYVGVGAEYRKAAVIGGQYVQFLNVSDNDFRSIHIPIAVGYCHRVRINGNAIENVGSFAMVLGACGIVAVSGNSILDFGRGITCEGACVGINVSGNSIINPKTAGAEKTGVRVAGTTNQGIISGNTIGFLSGTAGTGVIVDQGSGKTTNIAVAGNIITGFTTAKTAPAATSGTPNFTTIGTNY